MYARSSDYGISRDTLRAWRVLIDRGFHKQGSGGGPYEYTSISNDVRLIFCGTSNYVAPKRFKITYDVIDFKVANVTGSPNNRGVINSPNFPET